MTTDEMVGRNIERVSCLLLQAVELEEQAWFFNVRGEHERARRAAVGACEVRADALALAGEMSDA